MRGVALAALAFLATGTSGAGAQETFYGFRLLDLERQTVKWHSARWGESAALTYAFAAETIVTENARNCARMVPAEEAYARSGITSAAFRREVAAAFRMWEEVAGITFRESPSPRSADILIGAQADPMGRAFTNVSLKATAGGRKVIARALICLNPHQPWKIGFDGDLSVYDVRHTIAHEIGHAIGLDHPGSSGQLMSYRYDESRQGLQPGDIKGAALLYGPGPGWPRLTETGSLPRAARPQDASPGRPLAIGDTSPGE